MAGLPPFADGVYTTILTPQPTTVVPPNASASGMVGTGTLGVPGIPYLVSTENDVLRSVGYQTTAAHDLGTYAKQYIYACQDMKQPAYLYIVRATDGTDTAATVTVKDTQGTPGNVVVFTGFSTGSGLNGGTAQCTLLTQYPTGQNTYNLTLTTPFGASETFTNIVGYTTVSGTSSYNAATLVANTIAAVNNGQSTGRGPSQYWTASAPGTQSTFAPSLVAFAAAGGTDGASGVTSSNLIGTQSLASSKGLYALQGQNIAQFCIAGLTDLTQAASMAQFAVAQPSLAVGPAFTQGTPIATQVTSKVTNNFTSPYSVAVSDFYQWNDPINGLRWLSPESAIMGIIASQPPSYSPGNQPANGLSFIVQTERTQNPRGATEANLATSNNITWIGPMNRAPSQLGLANGQNASGAAGRDGINWTKLTNWIVTNAQSALGTIVDDLQTQSPTDATRSYAKKICNDLLSKANLDLYLVTCDKSNNSNATIAAGYLFIRLDMTYKGVARFVNLLANGSTTVIIPPTA